MTSEMRDPNPTPWQKSRRELRQMLLSYDTMWEIVAAAMAAAMKAHENPSLLCLDVGMGHSLLPYVRHSAPGWRITALESKPYLLAIARRQITESGLLDRVEVHEGTLDSVDSESRFDGAVMLSGLGLLKGEGPRLALLRDVTRRLRPGAPLIVGTRISGGPFLETVMDELLRLVGVDSEGLDRRHATLAELDELASDEAFFSLVRAAGFAEPRQLFAFLQMRVFLLRAS